MFSEKAKWFRPDSDYVTVCPDKKRSKEERRQRLADGTFYQLRKGTIWVGWENVPEKIWQNMRKNMRMISCEGVGTSSWIWRVNSGQKWPEITSPVKFEIFPVPKSFFIQWLPYLPYCHIWQRPTCFPIFQLDSWQLSKMRTNLEKIKKIILKNAAVSSWSAEDEWNQKASNSGLGEKNMTCTVNFNGVWMFIVLGQRFHILMTKLCKFKILNFI